MVRVAVVCPYYHPVENAPTNRLLPLVRGLRERGHEVTVVTARGARPVADETVITVPAAFPDNSQSPVRRLASEIWFSIVVAWAVRKLPAGTVAIVSSPPFLVAWFALLVARGPVILDIRDLYPQAFVDAGLLRAGSIAHRVLAALERDAYARARIVVTVSEGLRRAIESCTGVAPALVRNGYDPHLFVPSADQSAGFTVVVHGTAGRMQSVESLIEIADALAKLAPQIQLKVIGFGPGERFLRANKRANLHFLGRLPKSELADEVRSSHLALVLRRDDTIGRTALPVRAFEAIGAGLPLLVAPETEFSAILRAHDLGIAIPSTDPTAIAAAIAGLQADPVAYARHRAAVLAHRAEYSTDAIPSAFATLAEETCASS